MTKSGKRYTVERRESNPGLPFSIRTQAVGTLNVSGCGYIGLWTAGAEDRSGCGQLGLETYRAVDS